MNPAHNSTTTGFRSPGRETVELVLRAAADVIFSDGVSPAVLAQWVDETCFLLSLSPPIGTPIEEVVTVPVEFGPVSLGPDNTSRFGRRPVYDAPLPPE